jgi:CheY-like chemotaxis protein
VSISFINICFSGEYLGERYMYNNQLVGLHIDDSPTVIRVVCDAFRSAGYIMRTATGLENLELRVSGTDEALKEKKLERLNLEGIDFMIIDLDLSGEIISRTVDGNSGDSTGQHMAGIQIGAMIGEIYPQLNVPFLLYSGQKPEVVNKLMQESDLYISEVGDRYWGFVTKEMGSEDTLVKIVDQKLKEKKS